jgi:exodeoxyribonuclease VII large subunit
VGHEVDVTIADFVADLRAPTPSAAAEMVVAAKDEFCSRIDRLAHRLQVSAETRLAMRGRHAAELTHQLRRAGVALLVRRERGYRSLRLRLEARDLRRHLAAIRGRLTSANGRLTVAATRRRHRADSRLRTLAGRLENLSPLAVLARGYAVCWNADRTAIIRRASAVSPGDRVRVTLHEGELACEVRAGDTDGTDNQGL